MIAAQDLRIGNWIEYDGWHPDLQLKAPKEIKPYPVKVKSIEWFEDEKEHCIEDISGMGRGFPSSFKPIPLTEEILLKAGFEKMSSHEYQCGKIIITKSVRENMFWFEWNSDYQNENQLWIKTVHQLQNLIYVISGGEELNITL